MRPTAAEKKRQLLEHLQVPGTSFGEACAAVGRTTFAAFAWRRKDPEFDLAVKELMKKNAAYRQQQESERRKKRLERWRELVRHWSEEMAV